MLNLFLILWQSTIENAQVKYINSSTALVLVVLIIQRVHEIFNLEE
jgi:hypothetical protein